MSRRQIIATAAVTCVALAAVYIWIAALAHDEAGQARQQEVVDSVVRAMDDSLRADRELRQLLLNEQERSDSATQAETEIAAEAAADRKVDFLWSVYNEAACKSGNTAARSVFERHATQKFRRYLKQRSAALPELLFFPLNDMASTSIWHFQQDWFAVSTPTIGSSIVLRITTNSGGGFLIDDIRQASKPADEAYSDGGGREEEERDDYPK